MIKGISHITLAIRNLERSIHFYVETMGFTLVMRSDRTAYFLAGDLWFCVVEDPDLSTQARSDYTHIAFAIEQEDFPLLEAKIRSAEVHIFKTNESEGDSLYFLDPDGHKLEIHCGTLETRLEEIQQNPWDNAKVFR
ncbi:MAG TPA: glutathione transferase [Deltaproteobacteria bacterium]|nr:glutathione transferase [Deltaproteobacteria bacterium]HCP44799.1 glutathione transferase [Deltaproteobacteria bacterium]